MDIEKDLTILGEEVIEAGNLQKGDILVLGTSTSEIIGSHIGKNSNQEIGNRVVSTLINLLQPKGIYLGVQGCEHINRAIIIEKEAAIFGNYNIVNVVPTIKAGGAACNAAYNLFKNPIAIEHINAKAGIDIGDTSIGMHILFVQVPFRSSIKKIGHAHVSALTSRPKYIGGPRASYS